MQTNQGAGVFRVVEELLQSDERVVAAFVFGSVARGLAGRESDVDVGVLFDTAPLATDREEMIERLSALLKRDVDLVVLNDANPIIARQVLKGVPVVTRDPKALARFIVRANALYHDLKRIRRPIEIAIARGFTSHGR